MTPVPATAPARSPESEPRPLRSLGGLAVAVMRQWWPQVAALLAASAVVTTTIAGALGVGASLTRGLRDLAVERLGGIEAAVLADEPFTAGLAERLAASAGESGRITPALVLTVAVDATGGAAGGRRGTRATLLACDDLPALGFTPAPPAADGGAAFVNRVLADALGLAAGDAIVLRIPQRSAVPSESPLGRRTGESVGRRLTVADVLPDAGLGRFSLRPVQVTGPLIVTSLETAQAILRRQGVVNAVFAAGGGASGDSAAGGSAPAASTAAADRLRQALEPGLEDYGLAIEPAPGDEATLRLVSRRLILPPEVDRAAAELLTPLGGTPSLVFLANAILTPTEGKGASTARPQVPYSTLAGVAATTLPCGDLVAADGMSLPQPGPGEVIIDSWLADDLAAQGGAVAIGDPLEIEFFLPETRDGRVEETSETLRISGIAALAGAATARAFVPEVEGITDEASIADWDPPFPFDRARVRTTAPHDEDDRYWKAYGPTPKAFVALDTARRLAASRFGETTAWLVPRRGVADLDALRGQLAAALRPEQLGLRVEPLRADALAAARGSTPFGGLFLALSSFLVGAGLLLEWLLFQLLVAARRRDVGLLAALGWPPRRIAGLLVLVGGAAAIGGVVLGMLAGPAWAQLLVALLGRSWSDAVTAAPVAAFAAGPPQWTELWPAALAAAGLSLGAIAWAAWRAGRLPPLAALRERSDLAGGGGVPHAVDVPRRSFVDRLFGRPGRVSGGLHPRSAVPSQLVSGLAVGSLLIAAGGLAVAARGAAWQTAVGLFFGAGLLALGALLLLVRRRLGAAAAAGPPWTLLHLARRGLAWRPGRAFSVAAIVAVAQFLIVAVSSFALRPPADLSDRRSPTGGWTEIVRFGEPTSVDPSDPQTRATLGLATAAEQVLAGCTIARLRATTGDDASCTNLYAAARPTLLGVGADFIERGGFRFVAHAADPGAAANPWTLLARRRAPGAPVPAILDQATAQWALQLGGVGAVFTIPDEAGHAVAFEIVGLLDAGILQGYVIVAEADVRRLFPSRSGYGMALVDASGVPPGQRRDVPAALAAAWADAGPEVEDAAARLRSLQAVQNTFLGGFQALGTLGLLLGTAGVAAVQLQNVFERRGQLALLRAIGFSTSRVRLLLVLETLLTVGLGLAAGTMAGLLAVAPLLSGSGTARLPLGWIAITCGLSFAAALLAGLGAASRHTIPIRPRSE